MRRSGPALLPFGALLMIVGAAGHFGVVWAVGVVLAAAGLAVLVASRSLLAGLALAVVLIAGLAVYPWLAERSATSGKAHWSVRAREQYNFGLVVAAGRVAELDGSEARLLDARTGRRLAEASVENFASLALDGSFFAVDNEELTAFDRQGRRLWRRAAPIGPAAAAGGITLLSACQRGRCGVRGVDAKGRVRWTRRAADRSTSLPLQFPKQLKSGLELLPDVALVSGPDGKASNAALDARDGHPLVSSHRGARDTVAPGRALLQTRLSGADCRLDIVTRSERKSARTVCGRVDGLATRAYVSSLSGEVDTVDLRTGRVHRLGEVDTSRTVGGDRVLVRRSGHQLTAVDPATGKKLWSRGFSGDRPTVAVSGAVVSVVDEPHGLNPFLGGDARKQGDELVVLDARTGKERGTLVAPAGIRGTVALGDGLVLAVDKDGVHRVVG